MGSKKIEVTQGTTEWHTWRGPGVGSSDAAAILEKSPYKTKRDLFLEKLGFWEVDNSGKEDLFRIGHGVEVLARDLFEKQTGFKMPPACFEKDEIFRASLDGYDKKEGVFEAKFTGRENLKNAKNGKIPEHHKIQIQHQLYTSESDKAYWVGHDSKKTGVIVEVGRDEKLIKQMVDEVYRFWEMLKKGQAPELSARDTLVLTGDSQKKLADELKKLKAKKDEIEAKYKEIEDQIKGFGDHPKIFCNGLLIQEIERKGSVDYKKVPEIKSLTDEYLEEYRKASSIYKKITFKKDA